jgi:hypothetical protein
LQEFFTSFTQCSNGSLLTFVIKLWKESLNSDGQQSHQMQQKMNTEKYDIIQTVVEGKLLGIMLKM